MSAGMNGQMMPEARVVDGGAIAQCPLAILSGETTGPNGWGGKKERELGKTRARQKGERTWSDLEGERMCGTMPPWLRGTGAHPARG